MKQETEQNLKFQKKCGEKLFFFDNSGACMRFLVE